jgi:ABC-2 type transport system permease protein
MFGPIFRFELRQQVKSPLFWIIAGTFAAIAFAAAASDTIQIGGGIGNTHRNAPYVVMTMLAFFSLFGMFLIPVFVGGAALRDFEAGTAEMFFATPMSRTSYLLGRFVAGYLTAVGVLIAVALGLWLGSKMPWLDPQRLGPTSLPAYGYGFAVLVLPNLFFLSAFLFLMALLMRSLLGTYIGVIAFFVLWTVAQVLYGNGPEHLTLTALIDPFGLGAFDVATRYWSASDRNTQLPEVAGLMLVNRLIWTAAGSALLVAALATFRPDKGAIRLWPWRRKKPLAVEADTVHRPQVIPSVQLREGAGARWAQLLRLARFDTRGVVGGVGFLVIMAFGLMNLGFRLAFGGEFYGTKVYPVTHLMTQFMQGSYLFLLIIIIAFYSGELVWRERSGRISEVSDAFPLPDWLPLLSKLIALASVIVLFLLVGSLECVAYQLIRGYYHIEPGLYLSNIALTAMPFLLIGTLMLVLQVLANNKFLGYLLAVLLLIHNLVLNQLHFEHLLYHFGGAPDTPYSDMNGYGHFLAATLWFRAYWACLAIALCVVASLFWTRGIAQGWKERSRIARARFRAPSRVIFATSLAAFAALGIWIYYNTVILNRYVPSDVANDRLADYEKQYRQYKDLPQPKIAEVKADVDIYPHERRVEVRGHYRLINRSSSPISDLHVWRMEGARLVALNFAPHEVVSDNTTLHYTIYRLKQPLAPGESMDFDFQVQYWSRGFRNAPNDTRVVDNGTFFDNMDMFPHFGYNEAGQLQDRNERRKRGLGPVPRMPKIDDEKARAYSLLCCDADWVSFETTVSTSADQIALAPGYLEREWTEGGRHYFHYKMDKPILGFFSFQSARYLVKRDKWNDVALEVYYDPQHPYNVERMIYAMKKSLAHYSEVYAPFQFHQMRVLEFPDYASFAQSFANTVPFSESIGFIADLRNKDDIDYVFYVTAHEVAHQWWAHQVIGAYLQGVTMLDETFAQYSSLMLQEHEYGPEQMRRFLKYELDQYLTNRGGELVEEMPLGLVENQDYIHYRKGSVNMYALKDYLGEPSVDKTLARFDRETAFQQPPYTTTREFLSDLREEAGPQWSPLIADLFDKITFFDNRVLAATAKKRADGKYDVTLKLHAAKFYADGVGKETPAKIDLPIDIGVFARASDGKEQHEKVLLLEKRDIADGDSSVTVTVDGEPFEAGVDPFNKLVDRVSDDNRMRVTIEH